MVVRPDTTPPIDTPEVLDFVIRRAREVSPVRVHPMAALTKGRDGREMVEIGFLSDAGAVAFTDGDRVVADAKVMARALTYARAWGALVIGHVQDPGLSAGAVAASGKFATLRGPVRRLAHRRTDGARTRSRARRDDRARAIMPTRSPPPPPCPRCDAQGRPGST